MDNYQELKIWQEGRKLVKAIYELSANFPKEEMYGLTSQVRRAAISVPSNIAEGTRRANDSKRYQITHRNDCQVQRHSKSLKIQ